jgi:sugar-phosphatase
VDLVVPIPGAKAPLARLPAGRWGVATSGTDSVARSRLAHAGLPVPDVLISAEMVRHGKPDPAACVVFEDAPSGVAAATAAGAIVVGVLSWAEPGSLDVRYTVKDLRAVEVRANGERLRVELHDPPAKT